jgi:3-oxoacyl-[acyl-carrier-protein] synthase-3
VSRYGQIVATGSYRPEIEVSNDELRRRFVDLPEFVDKMEESTGILKRWYAPDDWATSDLAVRAARQALEPAAGRRTSIC